MTSSDYCTAKHDNTYTSEKLSCQPPARERPRQSTAYWLDDQAGREYNSCYCALCDKVYPSLRRREQHVARSPNHPYCEVCDRRFLNGNALRAHLEFSYDHHKKARDPKYEGFEFKPFNLQDIIWETYNEFDFDDLDCVGDEVPECIEHLVKCDEGEEEEENESGPPVADFTCPICEHTPNTVCSTICGHLFCAPCIKLAFEISGSCPVCDEKGNVKQLRKMYISA